MNPKAVQLLAFAGAAILIASCSEKLAATPAAAGPLGKYYDDIKSILTEERLRQVADPGVAELSSEVKDSDRDRSIVWSWPGDRIHVVDLGFTKIETPMDNQLGVKQFRMLVNEEHGPKTGREYVERNYRSISAEEMAQIQRDMQAALSERVERGEITAEQARIAGGLGGEVSGTERPVETIDGIGEACRWVPNDSTLVIGQGGVFLSIYSNLSADPVENREAALKLAKLILGN